MDGFVDDLMEQVFKKGEKEYALDEETRQLMNEIRKKIKNSPRYLTSSNNTDEYFKNLQERLVERISVENDDKKKIILMEQYLQIINNRQIIESLCG